MTRSIRNFWQWFFLGGMRKYENKRIRIYPGYMKLFNLWSFLYIFIAICISKYVTVDVNLLASSLLLPAAGVFIGVSFAWGANAHALLQTAEIEDLVSHNDGGIEEYAYTFQLSMLVILTTIAMWSLAGIGIFTAINTEYKNIIKVILLASSAIAVRECWHIIIGSTELLITRYYIARNKKINM